MAQSIKLNDNLFWDQSSLYAPGLFQSLMTRQACTSGSVTIPNVFRGIVFAIGGGDKSGIYSVYSGSTGSVNVATLVNDADVTISGSTNTLTIAVTTYRQIFYIGNKVL